MKRDFTEVKQRLLKRTKAERRLELALESMIKNSDPKELADWLVTHPVCTPSTRNCIVLAKDHVDFLKDKYGNGLIAYVLYGGVPREPTRSERHRDIDALAVMKRDIKLPRMYRRLNVQTVPMELLSHKNLSAPSPATLPSKLLRDDPGALRRTFYLPIFPLHDTNGFIAHTRDIARKCMKMNDIEGYVGIHFANRLRLLRSAGNKPTLEDESRVYSEVMDGLRINQEIKELLLQRHLESVLPLIQQGALREQDG
ncbi:Uncharacterised protein [uncultured archaeon]|nr:Uncharacterised protein [uncultured archaeon]